jgi:hypothetical protein
MLATDLQQLIGVRTMAKFIAKLAVLTVSGLLSSTSLLVQTAEARSRDFGAILGAMGSMMPTQPNAPITKGVGSSGKKMSTPTASPAQAGNARIPSVSKVPKAMSPANSPFLRNR